MPLNEYDEIIESGKAPVGNEYDDMLDNQGTQDKQQLDAAKAVASKRDPKRWAKVLDISHRTKLPAEVVDRNFDQVSAEDSRQKASNEYDKLLTDTPGLTSWLKNPDNATVGRDEIAALSRVDRGSRIISEQKDQKTSIVGAGKTGANDLVVSGGHLAAAYGMGDPAAVARTVAAANKRAAELRAAAPDYAKEFQSAMQQHSGDVNKAFKAFMAAQDEAGRSGVQQALDVFKTGKATVGEAMDMIRAAVSRPRGLTYQATEGLAQMLPALGGSTGGAALGAVIGSFFFGPPGAVIGGALGTSAGTFVGMAPTSIGGEINSELQKRGVDVTDENALRAAYSNPKLMADIRAKAERKGFTVAAVNALVAPLGGKLLKLAGPEAKLATKALATAGDVTVQAGGVGASEAAGQKAGGEKVDVGAALQSSIATLGYSVGQEAVGAGRRALFHADPAKAAVEVTTQADEALRAHRDAQALSEIGAAVTDAKTTQQVPERLKSLVEMATGNDPDAQVYFQTKDWDEHFQGAGASPAKAADDVMGDGGKAYYDAKATGAPLAIPLGDYVSKVATTEHWGKLLPFARTKPDGMSLSEASEYLKDLPKTMEAIANEPAVTPPPTAPASEQLEILNRAKAELEAEVGRLTNSPEARERYQQQLDQVNAAIRGHAATAVRENVEAQLKEAGVAPSVAKAQAALYEAAFRSLGERAGVDPLALFNRYNLRVISENAKSPINPKGEEANLPPVSPEEAAARSQLQSKAENAVERDAFSRPDPYLIESRARNTALKTEAGEYTYARTAGGTLRTNLKKVSTEGLIDEYGRLFKAQNEDQNKAVPTVASDENMPTFASGRDYVGMKGSAVIAKRRIAQRAKSIAKLEAELASRGIDDMGALIKDSFELFQSAAPAGGEQPGPFQSDALQRYKDIVRQLEAYPEERRQLLASALKLPPDILHLKQDERGRIIVDAARQVTIELLKNADRSTFLHESAHFYLEVLADLAKAEHPEGNLAADYKTIRDWLGVEGNAGLTRDQHEQFARGFETYLLEGKAPSQSLRDAFYRFKRWLLGIYQQVSTLGVELSPDVRKVFDRLLAVDSELAQAEEDAKAAPLFEDPKAVGMSATEAESYEQTVRAAHQAAEEALTTRMMKQIRREESAEWKAKRDPIEAAVTEEVNKRSEYRALSFLRNETNPDGTPLPEGTPTFKLARESVKETYGADAAKALPKGVTAKDGLHPDLVAEVFGYSSGRELIEAISNAPAKDALIKSQTDARMQLEHGERLSDFQVRDIARETVQNEKRSDVLRKELEVLASDHLSTLKGLVRKVTQLVPPTEAVKEEADRIIGAKAVKDVRPVIYERTAERLAKEAREALLKGDVEAAFNAKRKELLTNEVFRAASDARDAIDGALDDWKKFFRRDEQLSKTRDMDLVNAGRAILAWFGVGRADKPPFAYLEQIKKFDPEMYETVAGMVNEATSGSVAKDYRALSYDDFTALNETVSSLWKLSRRNRQIEIDGAKVDRREVQRQLISRIDEISTPKEKPGYSRAVTKWEKTQHYLMGVRAMLRRVEFWADAMDSGKSDGVFRKYIWNPISEGAAAYRLAKREVLKDYLEVVKPIETSMRSGTIDAKELGYEFKNKTELLGALLHTGNDSNLQKLLRGRNWGTIDEAGVLDRGRWDAFIDRMQKDGTLTKADYDYAQGVWDLFEKLKPGAQKVHNELYGHYFSEITAAPFDTPFGRYAGGYYPALTDEFMVTDQALRREQEAFLQGGNSFMFPTTGRGFTKTRVEAYAKPLVLDAGVVPLGFDAVLRFTHIEPRVRDVARIVTNPEFRNALDQFDSSVGREMLVPWLQRAAQQRTQKRGELPAMDKFWRWMRNGTGMQILAANAVVALEQITHMPAAAVKVPPAKLAAALWRYMRSPHDVADAMSEKSEYMRTRENAAVMEIQKSIDNLILDPSKYQKLREFAGEHGYFLSRAVQHVSDVMAWTGAYDHAIEKGADEKGAVRIADSAVRETQGSYSPEDLSRFETSTPFVRTFSLFYSFFNAKANLLQTEFTSTARDMGLRKGAGRLLYVYTFGFLVPAILGHAIKEVATGQPLEEDDEGPAGAFLRLFFGGQFDMASRMIPFAGPVAQAVVGGFTNKAADDNIMVSPAVSTIESMAHSPGDVYKAVHEKTLTNRAIKDVLTLVGAFSNLPLAPLARPINYLRDVDQGKKRPRSSVDLLRGMATGR